MNIDDLLNVVAEQESNSCSECGKESKLHLTNSDGLENKLHFMGKIEPMTFLGYQTYSKNGSNPFSDMAPVSLSHYPYNGSDVYRCDSCMAIFFIYLETGGHAARYQARWIRRDLNFLP
ncbi:hypothetical protein [Shewanella algae]|uniref:hypothetical protein n=1 Tax=Shewanella algae TaxID=38313 RepID=UPI000AE7FCE9|nr:hypothetical protein [Shewanella algae]